MMEIRYCAFIDILGFSELVRRISAEPDVYQGLLKVLSDIRLRTHIGIKGGEAQFRAQNFSDAIVLSSAMTPAGLWHLLLSIDALAFGLLQQGVFIRGGVSRQRLHHDDHIVFGDALLDAYHLESKIAKFPRVILSRTVFCDAEQYASSDEPWRTYFNSRLIKADDGPAFLHVLMDLDAFNRAPRNLSSNADQHPLFLAGSTIRKRILHGLNDAMDRPQHFEKIKWFADYWNRTVCAGGVPEDRWLAPIVVAGGFDNRVGTLPFRHISIP
jgi:hypothetical protein